MTKKLSIADQLRSDLASIEGHQAELVTERDEVSYPALVDRQPQAIKRLAAINEEIGNLTTRAQTIGPALKEAIRREGVAREQAAAEKRRSDAREAEALCSDAEAIAEKLDADLAAVRQHAAEIEAVMIKIRRLTGAGPQFEQVRIFLVRALKTAVHRGPLHVEPVAPGEATTVSQASTSWLRSIRGAIARILDTAASLAA